MFGTKDRELDMPENGCESSVVYSDDDDKDWEAKVSINNKNDGEAPCCGRCGSCDMVSR